MTRDGRQLFVGATPVPFPVPLEFESRITEPTARTPTRRCLPTCCGRSSSHACPRRQGHKPVKCVTENYAVLAEHVDASRATGGIGADPAPSRRPKRASPAPPLGVGKKS